MPHKPIIHVLSYTQITTSEYPVMMPVYHLDRDDCSIAMPREFRRIPDYEGRIEHYETWIRRQIADKDPATLVALDNIYNQSTNGGVIIGTLAQCVPFYTHAHILRDIILELAQGAAE